MIEAQEYADSSRPWEELANGIVEQAAKDYRETLERLKQNPGDDKLEKMRMMIEKAFHSDWLARLSNDNGVLIMYRIQKEYGLE